MTTITILVQGMNRILLVTVFSTGAFLMLNNLSIFTNITFLHIIEIIF